MSRKYRQKTFFKAVFNFRENPRGWLVFIAVMVLLPVLIVVVKATESPEEKALHAYEQGLSKHAPSVLKISGKLDGIEEETNYTPRPHHGIGVRSTDRYLTLKETNDTYHLPDYLNWYLSNKEIKAAKKITIEYYDQVHYRFYKDEGWTQTYDENGFARMVPNLPYHDVVGISLDGKTYLTLDVYKFLDHQIIWFIVPLLLFYLWMGVCSVIFRSR